MKNQVIILGIMLFLGACKQNDFVNYKKTLKEQAEIMGQALVKKDLRTFATYTYPQIVDMMGGEEEMIKTMENGMKEKEAKGESITKVTFEEPSAIIKMEQELQSTIIQTTEMKVPGGTMLISSTLIAISTDKGKHWYFIETSGKTIQTLRETFPNLSSDLPIPEPLKPEFYKN